MRKGIFLDLDGTLLNDKYKISPMNKRAIKKKIKDGYLVFIITGKNFVESIKYYNELNLTTPLITSSGQHISNPSSGNFRKEFVLLKHDDIKIVEKFIKETFKINNRVLVTHGQKKIMTNNSQSNLNKIIGNSENEILSKTIADAIDLYFEVKTKNKEKVLEVIKKANEKFKNKYEFTFWLTDNNYLVISVKPFNIGKSIAMKKMKELFELECVVAFGNGWSDRNMLKEADYGFAMKNAKESVKRFANYTTKFDNNNSGVGKELKNIK